MRVMLKCDIISVHLIAVQMKWERDYISRTRIQLLCWKSAIVLLILHSKRVTIRSFRVREWLTPFELKFWSHNVASKRGEKATNWSISFRKKWKMKNDSLEIWLYNYFKAISWKCCTIYLPVDKPTFISQLADDC